MSNTDPNGLISTASHHFWADSGLILLGDSITGDGPRQPARIPSNWTPHPYEPWQGRSDAGSYGDVYSFQVCKPHRFDASDSPV